MSRQDFTPKLGVNVADILLDEGNPRIRAGSDQNDCLARVLRKREQMLKLMESIAKDGLSTNPIILYIPSKSSKKLIVKDGNRRITALKLLNNPSLCLDTELRGRIQQIVKAHRSNISSKIDCIASGNLDAIQQEVMLRHSGELGGIGQIDWQSYMRTVYQLNNEMAADYKRAGQYLLWAEHHNLDVEDDFPITKGSDTIKSPYGV